MTHYDVLGVRPSASAEEIRAAYRRAAREAHPDSGGQADPSRMAAITEAWRVLGDPARRNAYDRAVYVATADGFAVAEPDVAAPVPRRPSTNPLARYQHPARFPWGLMALMAAIGIAAVIVGVIAFRPSPERPPDNLLQRGSCVTVAPNDDAVEVNCSAPHDGVVQRIVAFGATCPPAESGHLDRQGLGIACINRPPP